MKSVFWISLKTTDGQYFFYFTFIICIQMMESNKHRYFAERPFLKGQAIISISNEGKNTGSFENFQALTIGYLIGHSCQPNILYTKHSTPQSFQIIAAQNIGKGEVLLANYNEISYSLKNYFRCQCHEKQIKGFKYLRDDEKICILPSTIQSVVDCWKMQIKQILIIDDLLVPENVCIKLKKGKSRGIFSKKNFQVGDVLYEYRSILIPQQTRLIIRVNDIYEEFNVFDHTTNRGEKRQYFHFTTFMNHSCDPNIQYICREDDQLYYIEKCIKPISIGDQIKLDYMTLEDYDDGCSFQCDCGSIKCRKIITQKPNPKT